MKIDCAALISYFLVHNESVWESIPRVIYTKVLRIKCSPLLHKNVYNVSGMENSQFSWARASWTSAARDERLLLVFIAPLFLGLIIQSRCLSLLDPRCYSDGFFQRWLLSKLNCNLGAIGCRH